MGTAGAQCLVQAADSECHAGVFRECSAGPEKCVLSRHRHDGPVHAFVLKGRWYYLEHDWTAIEGSYAHEIPGEVHTLYVPEDVTEMMTLFHVTGAYTYLDEDGKPIRHEDVFTKIEAAVKHYEACGLGEDYVREFIR